MTAFVLDGRKIASDIQADLINEIEQLRERYRVTPGLATILLGGDPASETYVKLKQRSCEKVGIYSEVYKLSEDTNNEELIQLIHKLNEKEEIHGILVQLPLPSHIDEKEVLAKILPEKDVDGLNPVNMGNLVAGSAKFAPCTPLGVMELLNRAGVKIKGKNAVVVGSSYIVGKPMALMLLEKWATVTLCHIETKNLSDHTKQADILIVAVGKPFLITKEMVKKEAVVIDVGINRLENGKIVGDVDFQNVKEVASVISPVPGGVGPITIAMVLQNTIKATKCFFGINA